MPTCSTKVYKNISLKYTYARLYIPDNNKEWRLKAEMPIQYIIDFKNFVNSQQEDQARLQK